VAGRTLRAFRSRLIFRAILVIAFVGRRLPLSVGRAFGSAIGRLAWHVARRERKRALRNIALAFPDWPPAEHKRVIRSMFRHHGVSLFEIVWLPNVDQANVERTTRMENIEPVLDLVGAGKTVFVFTGHCGNWEWLAYTAGMRADVTVLQRERSEQGLNEFIVGLRSRVGVRTIDRGSASAARDLIQAMKRPGVIAFLIDQSIRAESAKVPFFGMPALTPIGPAKMAIRIAAPAVPAFIHRGTDGIQYIRFLEPIETRRGDDPVALTARLTRAIEEQVRAHPEQWVWMHDRWRDRPAWDVGATVQ
jgi:Kdo2-lipid IVA lauroyltransferase/acyltransferase